MPVPEERLYFAHDDIREEFLRWLKKVEVTDPYASQDTIGIREVLKAHFLIVDYFCDLEYGIGGVGPRDLHLLHSAVYRQFVSFEGEEKWDSRLEKLATLVFGLINDHPFHDANKRTALLVAIYGLKKMSRTPRVSQKDFEEFVVNVAEHKLPSYPGYERITKGAHEPEIAFIAHYFHRSTRELDSRIYTVTFHELNGILKAHGYALSNPSGNFIDVVRLDETRGFMGLGKPKTKEFRVAQIGFPGWKTQVSKAALRTVRDATDLTGEKGVDSQSFFRGVEPLYSLMNEYSEPLKRLADR